MLIPFITAVPWAGALRIDGGGIAWFAPSAFRLEYSSDHEPSFAAELDEVLEMRLVPTAEQLVWILRRSYPILENDRRRRAPHVKHLDQGRQRCAHLDGAVVRDVGQGSF